MWRQNAFLFFTLCLITRIIQGGWLDNRVSLPGIQDEVSSLVSDGTNVFAAGSFSNAGGAPAKNIARWDASGWHSLGDGVSGQIRQIALQENALFVIGNFNVAGATNLAKWNGLWSPVGQYMDGELMALTVASNFLYVARASSETNFVVSRWDGTNWNDIASAWVERFSLIDSMVVRPEGLIVAGKFHTLDGIEMNNIATWNGAWKSLGNGVKLEVDWAPNQWSWAEVFSLINFGTNLIAAGTFLTADDIPVNHVAAWNGSKWSALGEGLPQSFGCSSFDGCIYPVRSLATLNGKLFAGGHNALWMWDGDTWKSLIEAKFKKYDPGYGYPDPFVHILALAPYGDDVFFGGNFIQIGNMPSYGVALWHTEPTLEVLPQGDSILLSWPTQLGSAHIESSPALTNALWNSLTGAPAQTKLGHTAIQIPLPKDTDFFRVNFATGN